MPINRNAIIRYQVLDRCFRNPGRMYFIEDLLEECNTALMDLDPDNGGIQKRQLYDDIKFMESDMGWSIPLERTTYGKRKYYRYEDLSFSINNQPLNKSEVSRICSALQILSRFSGTPQFEWIDEMIPMLESKFGLVPQKSEVLCFENNIDLKGSNFISPFFDAINNKRVLSVVYQDFKADIPYTITFHPYYLKQYNSRWFVFGLNEDFDIPVWNLALDRILEIHETNKTYIESDTEWNEYFFDIVGVTKPNNSEIREIKLLFTAINAPYIITKPLHPTQKHKITEEGLEVRINVIPNYELEKLILSYGKEVEVLAPQDLRENISSIINQAALKYRN